LPKFERDHINGSAEYGRGGLHLAFSEQQSPISQTVHVKPKVQQKTAVELS